MATENFNPRPTPREPLLGKRGVATFVFSVVAVLISILSHAGDAPPCQSCAVPQLAEMSGEINALKEETDEELHRKERKQLKEEAEIISKKMADEQTAAYKAFFDEYQKVMIAYRKLDPNADSASILKVLRDPNREQQLNTLLTSQLESNPKMPAYQKKNLEKSFSVVLASSRSAWLRDPSLDSMFAEAEIEKRPRDRNEIFKEHAQDHMEKNQEVIESMVSNVYHRKKQEVLALKGRQDFTKKELRNLNLSVYLQNGTKGQVYDLNHEEFKNKSLDEITQIISKKIPADQGPSYCFPYPATEAQLKAALEGSEDGGEDIPKPREPLSEPVPQREVRATCDIAQSFEDNATTLNQASKDALKKCIEDVNGTGSKGQGARCEHGIESIQASVRSCASMLRPKDRSKTNLQLSMERAKSMEQGFKNAALSLLGITPEVDGIDTESFGKYQNVVTSPGSDESEPTGTCGPQAPKNYGRENWLTDALSKNANSCVRSSSLPYEKCMEEFKDQPQQLWQCQPKDKAEAMALALKDIEERMKTSIGGDREKLLRQKEQMLKDNDPYLLHRKASIEVSYLCKLPPAESKEKVKKEFGIGFDQTLPGPPPELKTTCGVFVKCLPLDAYLGTAAPIKFKHGGGGDSGTKKFKLKRPKGNRKTIECPIFDD